MNDTATIDDLSYEYMKEYLLQTGARKILEKCLGWIWQRVWDLSVKVSMVVIELKFAVLMFMETLNKFIPNAHVEIIREIDGTDKMESKRFDGLSDTGKTSQQVF